MFHLFDVPWLQVELEHVQAFFDADPGDEGVTWEAKADDKRGRLHAHTLAKAACGLANQIGGYVVIGAKQEGEGGPWSVPGITPPKDEHGLWIGKVIRGLNPVPRFDSKTWTLDDGRLVAVVRVEPVDQTPCMTRQGRVYERVSGETLPIEEPELLDRLFRRGEHARARATHFARRAAQRALDAPSWKHERSVGVAIGLASIGRETDDISSRLFVKTTREAIAASAWAFWGGGQPDDIEVRQQQDAYSVFGHFVNRQVLLADGSPGPPMRTTAMVQGIWDGSAAACETLNPAAVEHTGSLIETLRRGWRETAALVERLGGYGPAHLAVVVYVAQPAEPKVVGQSVSQPPPPPPKSTSYTQLPETTWIERTVSVSPPDEDMLASIGRELNRAGGIWADEPEPAPPAPERE